MTAQFGLYLGFPVILVIAYCVTDIQEVVAGSLGQPMGALCLQVLGPKAGLAMFAINIVAQWTVELGCIIAGSRVIYAYSRDDALPGSRWWKQVNKHTHTPVNALWFDLGINALLGAKILPIACRLCSALTKSQAFLCSHHQSPLEQSSASALLPSTPPSPSPSHSA